MRKQGIIIITLVAGLAVIGAGCSSSTTTTTNTSSGITNTELTNIPETNSSTSGSFNTGVNTNVTTNTSVTTSQTVTVTSSGVDKKTVTVSVGDTVHFVNNDSSSHEITSDPHPDHSNYPEFEVALSSGGRGSFTFTKKGSWGFHDHDDPFNSNWKGTIVVQ